MKNSSAMLLKDIGLVMETMERINLLFMQREVKSGEGIFLFKALLTLAILPKRLKRIFKLGSTLINI